MIDDPEGRIDYDVGGAGATVVLVPGSCSTGAAWRPIIASWSGRFRCVTTSLLGYGGTAERRRHDDPAMAHEAVAVEAVLRRASGSVHLVGHSFGGLVALAVALRDRVALASLTILEAPAAEMLRDGGEDDLYGAFRRMTDAYMADFRGGNPNAIEAMIDFYGGPGTYASWPPRLRAYAAETTPVNILDWATAYGFWITASALAQLDLPVLVIRGGASHPAVQRANELLAAHLGNARLTTIEGATHFMIATHVGEVARLIAEHVGSTPDEHARLVPQEPTDARLAQSAPSSARRRSSTCRSGT